MPPAWRERAAVLVVSRNARAVYVAQFGRKICHRLIQQPPDCNRHCVSSLLPCELSEVLTCGIL